MLIRHEISSLSNFFSNRHLSEEAARNAHRRVYHLGEGEDSGSKSLGGAAAYQAFLLVSHLSPWPYPR
jgi:hypothetical protein